MALLSRNADRIFWAARYLERAEDTARMVLQFGELFDDMPTNDPDENIFRWAPLLAVCGDRTLLQAEASERDVVNTLVCDPESSSSVAGCVAAARSNLRTTREVLPREAWHTVNDLSMFVSLDVSRAQDRRFRSHVLSRVANDSRRMDGILTSSMSRDAAWQMWRMGRYLERADMTTRVVGVRAAVLMAQAAKPVRAGDALRYDEVQWMGVLRSLSALQMYQRSKHGAIEASSVVRFLLFDPEFPRSVRFCLDEIDRSLDQLSRPESVRNAVSQARDALMSTMATTNDGADLDQAMDWVQSLIGKVNEAVTDRYLSIDGD
ncbi:MAG: alpha-E domain-containing protein [Ilumatobacter sp.]